jgi:hypothetical protein
VYQNPIPIKTTQDGEWIPTGFTHYTPEITSTGSQYGKVTIGNESLPTAAINCFHWTQYGGAVLEVRNAAKKTLKVYVNDICGGKDGGSCLQRLFNIDLSTPAVNSLFHEGWHTTEDGWFKDTGIRNFEPMQYNHPDRQDYDACEGAYQQIQYPLI